MMAPAMEQPKNQGTKMKETHMELLADYEGALINAGTPGDTRKAYLWNVGRLIDRMGMDALPTLTKADIRPMLRRLPAGDRSALLYIYMDFFDYLVSRGICNRNPARYGLRRILPRR